MQLKSSIIAISCACLKASAYADPGDTAFNSERELEPKDDIKRFSATDLDHSFPRIAINGKSQNILTAGYGQMIGNPEWK